MLFALSECCNPSAVRCVAKATEASLCQSCFCRRISVSSTEPIALGNGTERRACTDRLKLLMIADENNFCTTLSPLRRRAPAVDFHHASLIDDENIVAAKLISFTGSSRTPRRQACALQFPMMSSNLLPPCRQGQPHEHDSLALPRPHVQHTASSICQPRQSR